jgi:hypothetical protein
MTNISDDDGCGNTTTSVVTSHDRGAQDWARRRGDVLTGTVEPPEPESDSEPKPPKPPKEQQAEPPEDPDSEPEQEEG